MDIVYRKTGFKSEFSRFLMYKYKKKHLICLKKNDKYASKVIYTLSTIIVLFFNFRSTNRRNQEKCKRSPSSLYVKKVSSI